MPTFNENNLPQLTKSMYMGQSNWVSQNWKDTLTKHSRDVEGLLKQIQIFDIWKRLLAGNHGGISNDLVPEIIMDAFISVHFSGMGLYKQANVCLRAQLETALRLVYFSTHPVEYKWWKAGNEWYLALGGKDVWGKGYEYFCQLDEIKAFEKACDQKLFKSVSNIYKILSGYVHSGVLSFQTTPMRLSPKYKIDSYRKWKSNFREVQDCINTFLPLGFATEFKAAGINDQKKILKTISHAKYKSGVRRALALRFRGRI